MNIDPGPKTWHLEGGQAADQGLERSYRRVKSQRQPGSGPLGLWPEFRPTVEWWLCTSFAEFKTFAQLEVSKACA